MSIYKNLSGNTYGYVKVIEEDSCDSNYRRYWRCKCICGTICIIRGDTLLSNKHVNCGCKTSELRSIEQIQPNGYANVSRIYRQYKKRGLDSGKGFSLTRKEFESLIFSNCVYCGSPPNNCCKIKSKFSLVSIFYNGIDRIDNSLGYHKENCVSCCKTCNFAKSNMSLDKFFEWSAKVFNFLV